MFLKNGQCQGTETIAGNVQNVTEHNIILYYTMVNMGLRRPSECEPPKSESAISTNSPSYVNRIKDINQIFLQEKRSIEQNRIESLRKFMVGESMEFERQGNHH